MWINKIEFSAVAFGEPSEHTDNSIFNYLRKELTVLALTK
jgi:hypothetical protein